MFLISILALASLTYAEKIYNMRLIIYKNDSVELSSIGIKDGGVGPFLSAGKNNYYFEVISKDNRLLFNQSFELSFVTYPDIFGNPQAPKVIEFNKSEDFWNLPYFEDAALIQLFHEDKKIWKYEVEYLAARVPEQEKSPPKQNQNEIQDNLIFYAAGLMVITIIAVIIWNLLKRNKKAR